MKLQTHRRQMPTYFLIFFLLAILLMAAAGCDPETDVIGDLVEEELNDPDPNDVEGLDPEEPDLDEPEETVDEATGTPPTYYWPWLSHAIMDLSSGEVIPGPDIIMSEPGFMAEFTEAYRYEGRLFWVVEDSDIFTLEWIHLSFSVDYFENDNVDEVLNFEFRIEDLEPEEEAEGLQEIVIDYAETIEGFTVEIKSVALGRRQESSISTEPVDFVALEIIMYVEADYE